MTFVSFFYALKSAFEWVVNSKFVFAIFSIFIFIISIRSVLGFIWRFVRDKFIFERGKRL